MWPAVLANPTVQAALAERSELRQQTVRFWGTPETEIAATLRTLEPQLDGLEITTCLRAGELEVVARYDPTRQQAYENFVASLRNTYPDTLFSIDGRTVDEFVAQSLTEQNLTIGTAESCTAGLLAARLTERSGSSAWMLGGLVVYSNQAKCALARVPEDLIQRVGAVSADVAAAMAFGARNALHSDIGVGITGIAGPGGATAEKPVGLVYLHVTGSGKCLARKVIVPGSRAEVRDRSVTIAMHMVRELLTSQSIL
jgi:nicotinamide-nucleotide amidase